VGERGGVPRRVGERARIAVGVVSLSGDEAARIGDLGEPVGGIIGKIRLTAERIEACDPAALIVVRVDGRPVERIRGVCEQTAEFVSEGCALSEGIGCRNELTGLVA
jgi:hypothetical protein